MRIFWKQLLIHLGILAVSFIILTLVLTQGIRRFQTEQKVDELATLAQRVAISVEALAWYGWVEIPRFTQEIRNIHLYTGAAVIIIDSDLYSVIGVGPVDGVAYVYRDELEPLVYGETIIIWGTPDCPTLAQLLIVGYPFWHSNQFAGAVLVGYYMADLENTISAMYRITIAAMLGTGFFALFLIYLSSRTISRPLRQINEAASVIAGGDFEKRLPIRGKDEVGQLAREFNRMAESLQQQERIRREFIGNLSHDMRSPLTSMHGFLTAISDGTIPPENHEYYLQIVKDESERLIRLSNNILDIHRIQDWELELNLTEFDINDLIRQTILGFQQRALDKHIMITSHFAHSSDIVLADEDKLRRVMYNLIDNAIKFTPNDGEITIETTVDAQKVIISVADTGRGMTEEELKRAFDRFYKGDPSRNEDKMGSGLGLSIVKEFIRAHGESIEVTCEPGEGCVFVFTLPLV